MVFYISTRVISIGKADSLVSRSILITIIELDISQGRKVLSVTRTHVFIESNYQESYVSLLYQMTFDCFINNRSVVYLFLFLVFFFIEITNYKYETGFFFLKNCFATV